MPDYSKAQIYKVVDVGYNKCYIGSTIEKLCDRMAKHRNHYKRYLENKMNYLYVFKLFEEYGVENCKIYWIEDWQCNNKKELEAREGYWIEKMDCVNKRVEGRTKQQWTKDNIEKVREQNKALAQTEKYKAKKKERYEKNRDNILETNRQYRQDHKEEINTKRSIQINCQCGGSYTLRHKARHFKTDKHQQHLQTQNNTD